MVWIMTASLNKPQKYKATEFRTKALQAWRHGECSYMSQHFLNQQCCSLECQSSNLEYDEYFLVGYKIWGCNHSNYDIAAFWEVTTHPPADNCWQFTGTCCLYLLGRSGGNRFLQKLQLSYSEKIFGKWCHILW
jgi:hypothetical protein